MSKQQVIIDHQVIDPRSLCNAGPEEIDAALHEFKKAIVVYKRNDVKRLTLRSRTDQAVLGNLLLKKREQLAFLPGNREENTQYRTCNTGQSCGRKRNKSGRFESSPGFQSFVKTTFDFDVATAYRYMNLAENVGLGAGMQPNFVLAPSVKNDLGLPLRMLYAKPADFKDEMRRRNAEREGIPDQEEFEHHLFVQNALKEMRTTMSRVAFALCKAPDLDRDEVEAFLEESLNQIRGIRKESVTG